MTVNYTTNLSLGQPVTGTESGTWGDDVNNAVTSYLDIAIAGGLAITVTTADVTLTITQGTSVATNIGSTTAQYAILNVSGAMTAARNLILPSSSRQYVINNACTGGFLLTVKGSATTGVTLVNGEKAHVFWTGTDYSKLSNTPGGAGTFSSITNTGLTATRVVFSTTNGLETDSANLTFDGTNLTLLGGTANGVTFLNGSKVLTSGSALTYSGSTLSVSNGTQTAVISPRATASGGLAVGTDIASSGHVLNLAGDLNGGGTGGGVNISYYSTVSTVWSAALQIRNTASTYSDLLLMPSGGNVGIGTSSPGAKLQVTTGTNNNILLKDASHVTLTSLTSAITFSRPDGVNDLAAVFGWNTGGLALAGRESIVFATGGSSTYSNTVEAMRIDSSGNVGIGTSSPTFSLDVRGDGQKARFGNTTIGCTAGTYVSGTLWGFSNNGGNGGMFGDASTYVYFATAGAERMRIDSSGNVGIGTTSINSRLVVSNGSNKNIEFQPGATSYFFAYDRTASDYLDLNIAGDKLTFSTDNGTERMRIDSTGNVGIGITNPARKLVVSDAGAAGFEVGPGTGPSSGNEFLNYNRSTSAYLKQTTYSSEYLFYAGAGASTTALIIDTSGNVGIGASPNSLLDLTGNDPTLRFTDNAGSPASTFSIRSTDGTLKFRDVTNSSDRVTIDSSGRLLLGSSTVNANLGATGFQITSAETCAIVLCTDASGQAMRFFSSTTTQAGFITVNGATATYNSASDYRLKENVTQLVDGLNVISKLKPVKYTWKVDGKVGEGFIAHELQESIPLAVQGVKDQVDANGDIDPQGIDQSKIVPYLVSAIQEQQALITSLTARITALEST